MKLELMDTEDLLYMIKQHAIVQVLLERINQKKDPSRNVGPRERLSVESANRLRNSILANLFAFYKKRRYKDAKTIHN